MKKQLHIAFIITVSVLFSACGGDSEPVAEEKTGTHVWKSQTDNLQTAKDTAADLSSSLQLREQKSRPAD
jgi:outer membrane biogenesis lipoprotein LolB